jgi:hypothetical protein
MKTFSQFLYEVSATQQRLNDLRDQRDENKRLNADRYYVKLRKAHEKMRQNGPSDAANNAAKERAAAAEKKAEIQTQIKQHEAEKQNL